MIFTPTGALKGVLCSAGNSCEATNCIFSHEECPQPTEVAASTSESRDPVDEPEASPHEPPTKRRKVIYESLVDKPLSKADKIRAELAAARSASGSGSGAKRLDADNNSGHTRSHSEHVPPSLTKPVSPPLTSGIVASRPTSVQANNAQSGNVTDGDHTSLSKSAVISQETLNPRKLAHDPVGHNARTLFLKHLHGEMVRLNRLLTEADDIPKKLALQLREQELIKLALDEEEKPAREQSKVYGNVIRARIAFYKKMKLPEWLDHVKTTFARDDSDVNAKSDGIAIDTGLSPDQETLILHHLVADQSKLAKFGYIPEPPTEADIAAAAAAVAAADNFETCERCGASFQVFPDRNEEGKLTSRGPCKHHPNRVMFPSRSKGDIASGLSKEPFYPCCNEERGKPGCTEKDDHVFKASTPARLAAVLPFIRTPENSSPAKGRKGNNITAVAFDCEMGHTAFGMELIRLTAVSWPAGEELLDVLVRPLGAVIDLNSKFSGVWPEHFAQAVPYEKHVTTSKDTSSPGAADSILPIVDSPQKARELLCSFLTSQTPLIGHAIDNDLNAVRLCHPNIVDTVELYPHPRGLPYRLGLKNLSFKHLQRRIQMGGERGHDSLEDARATGDLVRVEVGRKWKLLSSRGWRIADGVLIPPMTPKTADSTADPNKSIESVDLLVAETFEDADQVAGKKRRKNRPGDGVAGENTEDEEVSLGNGIAAYAARMREESEQQTVPHGQH